MSTNILPAPYDTEVELALGADPDAETPRQTDYYRCQARLFEELGSVRGEILTAMRALEAKMPGLAIAEVTCYSGITVTYHFIYVGRHCCAEVRPLPHKNGGEFTLSGPEDRVLWHTYGGLIGCGRASNDPAKTIAAYVARNLGRKDRTGPSG